MDIVFNINSLGLEGLGATLSSLIRNCSNSNKLTFNFLCYKIKDKDKLNITLLLQSEGYKGLINFFDFDAEKIFGHLRSLHGDRTAYGRLLIANYVNSTSALYLDSDLIINIDILEINEIDLNNSLLAAVHGSSVKWALDNDFLINNLKWSGNESYFNSGVILFNLDKWRKDNIEKKWNLFAVKHSNNLLSHDQTILNYLCKGKFVTLPDDYNIAWEAQSTEINSNSKSIFHFIGSPKPWDILGKYLHKGFSFWYINNPTIWEKKYGKINKSTILRTWKIKNSIIRNLYINFAEK